MIPEPITWSALALAVWPLWVGYAVIVTVAIAEWMAHR